MLTSEQINSKVDAIVKSLNNRFGIFIIIFIIRTIKIIENIKR